MRAMAVLRALGPVDAKSIGRDSFLVWMAALPLVMAAGLRWGLPPLTHWLRDDLGFDLAPYNTLLASYFAALMVPLLVGQLLGFRLLDERDDDTLRALLVTPLPLESYLVYRIGVPLAVCTALALLAVPFTNLVELSWGRLLPLAVLYAVGAPMTALGMACIAQNKVQGLAFFKVLSTLQLIPVIAWFVPPPWQYLAGILPIYWPLKAFWAAAGDGSSYALALAVGFAYQGALLAVAIRRFKRIIHR